MRSAVNANYPRPTSTSHVCGACNSLIPAAAADNSLTMELLRCVHRIRLCTIYVCYLLLSTTGHCCERWMDGWMVDVGLVVCLYISIYHTRTILFSYVCCGDIQQISYVLGFVLIIKLLMLRSSVRRLCN